MSYVRSINDLFIVLNAQNILTRPNVERLKQHLPDDCGFFVEERFLQLTQTIIGIVADSNKRNCYGKQIRSFGVQCVFST